MASHDIAGNDIPERENKKKNLSTDVAERIEAMILIEHRFAPGDKLPAERDFAEELGVSRTSIREALKLLHANGTLELRRGVGAFVRDTPGIPRDPLGLSQIPDKHKLLRDWYEARLALEPSTMAWIVERASDEEIDQLQTLEEQVTFTIGDGGNYWLLDLEFHNALAKATHNEILHRLLAGIGQSVHQIVALSREFGLYEPFSLLALRSHGEIVRFLRLRDAEGATLAMRYHLLQCLRALKTEE